MDAPSPKDIVLAILSGSVSLAALLLVFVGFLLAQAASFGADTPDRIIKKYTTAGKIGTVPVFLCLLLGVVSVLWLRFQSNCLYEIDFWGFLALLGISILYAGLSVFYYLSPE